MRRYLAILLFGSLASSLVVAGESWQDKTPADWTEKDVLQILEHSPWVRNTAAQFKMDPSMGGMGGPGSMDPSNGGGGPMGGGGGMGPPGGGGGGGRGGGMGPRGGPGGTPPAFSVRWASAAPVREALAKSGAQSLIGEWAAEFYVITMSGPAGMRRPGAEAPPDADAARARRMASGLKAATTLKVKGKDPMSPARVEIIQSADGPVFAFLFPRTAGISADDKDVSFETALGPMQVKAKFSPKQMAYHGKTEL